MEWRDELDRGLRRGPLHGVPIAVKGFVLHMDLGKAHIFRGRFAGQIAEAFQDIDVLLIPVMKTPTPSAAEWEEMVKGDVADLLR